MRLNNRFCDNVYDESRCPYCTGELEEEMDERPYKDCPECGCVMYWDDYWQCTNCYCRIYSGEDDNDGTIEV